MRLIDILKLCILGAFVATIFTGFLFVMQSSDNTMEIYGKSAKRPPKFVPAYKTPEVGDKRIEADEIKNKDVDFVDVPKESKPILQPKVKVISQAKIPVKHPVISSATPTPTSTTRVLPTTTTTSTPAKSIKIAAVIETIPPKVFYELKETSRAPSIHIFYYPWYGSPQFNNGNYVHWNHMRLNKDNTKSTKPEDQHHPPGDIAAVQYPLLGPYSSRDSAVIERHMTWLSSAGVDVISVSWYPKGRADPSGVPPDPLMPTLLNMTDKFKMKMNFHLEPYEGRSALSIRDDIHYILSNYGKHPAFYRTSPKADSDSAKNLPLFYVYDTYKIPAEEWQAILTANGSFTIRQTEFDSLFIGLYVKKGDELFLKSAGFDGLYTYFAAEGFSHGSTVANWPALSTFCAKENLLFIPSVGPGYDDTAVRPWNSLNTRPREKGEYYKEHFKMAHTAKADIVSITSFNEWHEGTQIEPAVAFTDKNGTGTVYQPYDKSPKLYLEITLEMIKTYFTPHHEYIPMQIARVV